MIRFCRQQFALVVLIGITVNVWSSSGRAQPFSELVVFSASLSDVGNVHSRHQIPPSPPYFEGRFSNGPVWVERLAQLMEIPAPIASELGGTNYAWGAATTGSIEGIGDVVDNIDVQVQRYLSENTPRDDQLFLLWGGGNDFRRGQSDVAAPVKFIGQHITDLANKGASNFLVANMPQPPNSALIPYWERAGEFNPLLAEELARLKHSLQLTIYEVDVSRLIDNITANPQAFGLEHISEPACTDCEMGQIADPVQIADKPDEFLLWDDGHFSAHTHRLIGDAAFAAISAEVPTAPGDYNDDRVLNDVDIDLQAVEMKKNEQDLAKFDHNSDNVVKIDDRTIWVTDLKKTWFGDANLDGEFNSGDLVAVFSAGEYEDAFEDNSGWAEGDWDGDGDFLSGDLVVAFTDGGYEQGPRPGVNTVPEPSGISMMAIALALAAVSSTRRRGRRF